tara:strand:- start:3488 stop:4261 length:774 start_codon:yes stop_codon:yes gene_type:complete
MNIKLKNLKLLELRRKIKSKYSLGAWMQTCEPIIAEIFSKRKFDWVALDLEHGIFDVNKLQNIFRAIEINEKLPFVRLANHDTKFLNQLFDAGCCGLIIPNITNHKQLEKIIKFSSWPPDGIRGVGFSRANNFGQNFKEYKKLAQNPFIVAMIENVESFKNLKKILSVKGLDAILIGPYDLSASLGSPGNFKTKKFKNAIKSITIECKKNKISCGMHLVDPEKSKISTLRKQGHSFIPFSIDTVLINNILDKYLGKQ